jgi:hypothetical protein
MKVKIKNPDATKVKMSPEELQFWIHIRKKSGAMKKKKGKGSYDRKKFKNFNKD